MSTLFPSNISDYTARNIALKELRQWSDAGLVHTQQLSKLVKEIKTQLHKSNSPSKSIAKATNTLNKIFSKPEVRGEINYLNNRHIEFKLTFPELINEEIHFCLLYGEINARTKACRFDRTTPFKISVHALQRLIERLSLGSEKLVLDEIYSCIKLAINWHASASKVGAQCWPLMCTHGFFVGAPTPESLITTLITWIKYESLSKKWSEPINSLSQLRARNPSKLLDFIFIEEFLQSFPWMLKEHIPGPDTLRIAWESKELGGEVDPISLKSNDGDKDQLESAQINLAVNTGYKQPISNFLAGLNYSDLPPPFKAYSEHDAIVVQKRTDGNLIIGLKNGWVGKIPKISIERGKNLITDYQEPEVGDEIKVTINKIKYWEEEGAYLISMDPKDITSAFWSETKKQSPIGTEVFGKIETLLNSRFGVILSNGNRAIIEKIDVLAYLNTLEIKYETPIGLELMFKIIGYEESRKNLLLEIPSSADYKKKFISENLYVGNILKGTVIRNSHSFVVIQLEGGFSGILHQHNNWGMALPSEGATVIMTVIQADLELNQIELAAISPKTFDKHFYCLPISDEIWSQFTNTYHEGDFIEGQICNQLQNSGYIVATSSGVSGLLPIKELEWDSLEDDTQLQIQIGDIFKVKITKINHDKKKVKFSKRQADPHPLDDPEMANIQGLIYSGKVCSIVDYGYFVYIPLLKIAGLLHCSRIPAGVIMEKGEVINTKIESIDLIKKQVSLTLLDTN